MIWKETYSGNDINYIQIKSEIIQKNNKKSSNYNYNIVCYLQNGNIFDMKGKSSAG